LKWKKHIDTGPGKGAQRKLLSEREGGGDVGISIEDLPPRAQAQAIRKLQEQEQKRTRRGREASTVIPTQKENKYHNQETPRATEEGSVLTFGSKKEARRYDELMRKLKAGEIRDLKLQPQFTLQESFKTPEGKRVRAIRYVADFTYERPTEPDVTGEVHWLKVVEDAKSRPTKTQKYEIKKKLLLERFGLTIREV
jgi:hypothetical protein